MDSHRIHFSKEKLGAFCKKHHILSLALFGSVLTPNFSSTSDLDVLVHFNAEHVPTFFDLVDIESELSMIMGKQVDLKMPGDLSPYFREEVLSQAQVIYGQ